jgi:DNA-directed RNA polymerase subunit E'/Rpb7
MDPLFERRELKRDIHVESKYLMRNMNTSLLAQLKHKYEGVCAPEGYIQRDSLSIVEHSLGRLNLIKGGLDYSVRFQADICMPHPGQIFRARVALKSKIGIHVDLPPMKVLLPRDIHIGNGDFEDVQEKQEIEFEVIGSKFQPRDTDIVVLAKMRSIVKPAVAEAPRAEDEGPVLAAPVPGQSSESTERMKVVVDFASTKTAEQAPRRRKLRTSEEKKTNE